MPTSSSAPNLRISIDRGGTFTDVHASRPDGPDIILKLLSVDPSHYADAPTEGIRRILEITTGRLFERGKPLDLGLIERIRMGTTVGTNALLERKGARSALFITKGFKDLLRIGTQSRPKIFDLSVALPEVLYERVFEVDERVTLEGYTENPSLQVSSSPQFDSQSNPQSDPQSDPSLVTGKTGELIRILKSPDETSIVKSLEAAKDAGFESIAIMLLHSYVYPDHEQLVGRLARDMGLMVVESAALQPMIKAVPRGMSAVADAYLTPIIKDYIDRISNNFVGGLGSAGSRCEFMQSDGGLVDFRQFGGLRSVLSGPAGGVVGYAQTTWDEREKRAVIGFDMGGTSTDCSRFAGTYEHVFETTTAGVSIQSPQLDINTVAAGGGSMLFWRDGLFVVGPESAGAHPGPTCYRKGGPLTITDANVFLGRIQPEYFPKIFGPNEDEALGVELTQKAFHDLTHKINADNEAEGKPKLTAEEVALGFLRVADEVMARPIRALTEARGFDTSTHLLACFGGAGGQHACSLATALSIDRVVVHKYASILSAYGLSLADVVHEVQQPAAMEYTAANAEAIRLKLAGLADEATAHLIRQGMAADKIRHEMYLNMRYKGSTTSFMILGDLDSDFKGEFEQRHRREFGFNFKEKAILIDDFRVRGVASAATESHASPYEQMQRYEGALKGVSQKTVTEKGMPSNKVNVCFANKTGKAQWMDTPVFLFDSLKPGTRLVGPALILNDTLTVLVDVASEATVLETCVVIDLGSSSSSSSTSPSAPVSTSPSTPTSTVSPIQLSIFGHRFMSIAEQMGRSLQKTAVSTNIKERLDFSCALFSPDGGLVANAPHVPVHLGSMQFAVKYQHQRWLGKLQAGDVLVSNHPSCGGTHLPDITVISPVFEGDDIVFYVASRGHHADIGGILPGSMPPNSKFLYEEGAAIESEKLVSAGVFNEERITELLLREPARHPGCSGTRCLTDNLSDLKAQVAANNKGVQLIQSLVAESGLAEVQKYMYAIQATAERAVRDLLRHKFSETKGQPLRAVDYMDDGTPISLCVTIDGESGSATFDFGGTGTQVYGNTNAPVAITHSAIIYCLRALVGSDIPLNQGCLAPIDIVIPTGSLLSPAKTASVVGGNVQTSQRITDVVLKAFGACADSQGCMNNLTFGVGGTDAETGRHVDGFGYYETIGGGAGAGPTWAGSSGVHTHMTNTRITDPEVFEKRYPCILRQFGIRHGSGGSGLHRGGDGIVRDIEFTVPVQVSIISERRTRAPSGMAGGGDGKMGVNYWVQREMGQTVNLGGKATAKFGAGDRIIIETPGGGGWGVEV
ncbi:hypothetical protein TD95_005127 [Thielaviopsis punctulata]|uniref:5-oxoprolinase n=1 Tax=Thielaviopsis punctulata TaxID=72032 RepID=A0A0F4ZLA2_9PEZI|nr:hypothetical protein TD95_005127 [Thielaviopsis punctulata]